MPDLIGSLSAAPSGRATPVWFDSLAYCREKLLAGEPVPWGSPGELAAFAGWCGSRVGFLRIHASRGAIVNGC